MRSRFGRHWIELALVAVAAVWGGTFVVVKDAVAAYPLYSFLALRFVIAVVAFVLLFPRALRALDGPTVGYGLLAGAFLCGGYIFQTWGLQGTTASKAAFITGLFVVITPLMQAVVLRSVPRTATVAGALVALAGLWLLSGASTGGWNTGDTRVFLCAVAYSAHMIVLGGPARHRDVFALTFVQLATTAFACGVIAISTERLGWPETGQVWFALLVTGVLATAVAFAIQTYAQKHIPPARTALILISEPAFGGVFGWIAGESLGVRGIAGAVLILGGMVAAEMLGARGAGQKVALEPALEGPALPIVDEDA